MHFLKQARRQGAIEVITVQGQQAHGIERPVNRHMNQWLQLEIVALLIGFYHDNFVAMCQLVDDFTEFVDKLEAFIDIF